MSKSSSIRVGITLGDPSGVGPAITAKAIGRLKGLAQFTIIGDRWVFDRVQRKTKKEEFRFVDLNNVNRKNFCFGKVRAEYGRASIECLDKALELLRLKEIDCLVTCPISKEAVRLAGFPFSGHTEYFASRCKRADTVMMLLNSSMKFSLVTRHIRLSDVSRSITPRLLESNISLTRHNLKKLFGIRRPKIVVCGLNPHASDNGVIGDEENRIVKPLLEKLRKRGYSLDGPLSADVAISQAKEKKYDCVIAMFHDQALIPLKLSGKDSGVNITLGLPFIRTSPLHGTAFDIAAFPKKIDARSLMGAIKTAVKCTLNRRKA